MAESVRSGLPFVSVVMPVRNEGPFIEVSLAAVLAQDYPGDRLEVIVADGQSTDGTQARVERLRQAQPSLSLIENPGRIVPTGLNLAIARARGEVIVRVDGHCEISPDYVRRAVAHVWRGDADAVGGPLVTIGQTAQGRAIAVAMSSRFGVGGSTFRVGSTEPVFTDTVAFPAYLRSTLERVGRFDEELVRNQDDEYNYRLRKLGGRVLLAPDVKCRYYSRSGLRALFRQYFQYGYWKVRVLQKHPKQMSARQFAPPALVLALIVTAALAFVPVIGPLPFVALAGTYVLANLLASLLTSPRAPREAIYLPAAFAALHLSYGAGFLYGLIRFRDRWRTRPSDTPRPIVAT